MDKSFDSIVTKKMQEKEIEMLNVFSDICKKNGITFFLACGTSLGCARHAGFIPWDDDVDIYIHGSDYERLRNIFLTQDTGILSFQDYSTVKDYPYSFPKIVAKDTVLVEEELQHLSYQCGVYIDIFPLMETEENKYLSFISEKKRYRRYCFLKAYYFEFYGIKKILNKLAHVFINPLKVQQKLYDQYIRKQENTNCVIDVGTFGLQARLNAKDFESICILPFENANMPMPIGYKNYLTSYYGDYQQLPPENQQVSRHNISKLVIEGEQII